MAYTTDYPAIDRIGMKFSEMIKLSNRHEVSVVMRESLITPVSTGEEPAKHNVSKKFLTIRGAG